MSPDDARCLVRVERNGTRFRIYHPDTAAFLGDLLSPLAIEEGEAGSWGYRIDELRRGFDGKGEALLAMVLELREKEML